MSGWAPEEQARSSSDRWVNPKKWEEVTEDKKPVKRFRFRVLTPVSVGWEVWGTDDKPHRAKTKAELASVELRDDRFNPGKKEQPKETWAVGVVDVDAQMVKVWTFALATVKNAFRSVTAEWGSPFDYDLVCKQGKASDGKTVYSLTVHPSGKTPLAGAGADEWAAMKAAGFDLEAVWTGGDPFPSAPAASDSGGNVGAAGDLPF